MSELIGLGRMDTCCVAHVRTSSKRRAMEVSSTHWRSRRWALSGSAARSTLIAPGEERDSGERKRGHTLEAEAGKMCSGDTGYRLDDLDMGNTQ